MGCMRREALERGGLAGEHAGVAEVHMWSALHVGKQQLEVRRACLVHFAVLLLNDLLPTGVFLPWQLVLSYQRVVPTSALRGEDEAVAAACAQEEQLGQDLRERDLKSWAAYARKQLQIGDALDESVSAGAACTAGDQAGAAVADGRGPGYYCGGHFWLAEPGVAGKLTQQLQPEAVAEAAEVAADIADLGREMEIDVEAGAEVGKVEGGGQGVHGGLSAGSAAPETAAGALGSEQQQGAAIPAPTPHATGWDYDPRSDKDLLRRSSSKRALEHDDEDIIEGQGLRKRSSSSTSLQDVPGASGAAAASGLGAAFYDVEMTDVDGQPPALLGEQLQLEGEQRRQQQQQATALQRLLYHGRCVLTRI